MLPLSRAAERLPRRILENGVTAQVPANLESLVQRLEKVVVEQLMPRCISLGVSVDVLLQSVQNGSPKVVLVCNGCGKICHNLGGDEPGSDIGAWLESVSQAQPHENDQVSEVSEMAFTSG